MTDISSVSQSELTDRRQTLRRHRRWRTLQTLWQILAMGSLAGGLIWGLSLLDWTLQDPGQVTIEGNEVLADNTIRSVLPIRYPQSLLTLQPQAIAHHLESEAPIADATVVRQLFPPRLIVRIQERYPVAIAYLADGTSPSSERATSVPPNSGQPNVGQPNTRQSSQQVALLDEEGAWIPYEQYVALKPTQGLPQLKILGMREEYRNQWSTLYQYVSRSPVKISQIDWRDPGNLILKTELGIVYFGAYSDRFSGQLRILDQMRELPDQVSLDQIAYIDLRNPEVPLIEMSESVPVEP